MNLPVCYELGFLSATVSGAGESGVFSMEISGASGISTPIDASSPLKTLKFTVLAVNIVF